MSDRTKRFTTLITIVLILGISVTAESLPKAIPEKVGLSSKRLERVSELFQDLVDQQQLAGAVALVARQGKVAFFKAWGRMDLADDVPMGKDTIFRIASMTKPITCTAVMILHEEGRLFLNQPVSRYIPELAVSLQVYTGMLGDRAQYADQNRPISIRHLLTHTSGLTYGIFGDTPVDRAYNEARVLSPDLDGMVKKLAGLLRSTNPTTHETGWRSPSTLAKIPLSHGSQRCSPGEEVCIPRPWTISDSARCSSTAGNFRAPVSSAPRPSSSCPGTMSATSTRRKDMAMDWALPST